MIIFYIVYVYTHGCVLLHTQRVWLIFTHSPPLQSCHRLQYLPLTYFPPAVPSGQRQRGTTSTPQQQPSEPRNLQIPAKELQILCHQDQRNNYPPLAGCQETGEGKAFLQKTRLLPQLWAQLQASISIQGCWSRGANTPIPSEGCGSWERLMGHISTLTGQPQYLFPVSFSFFIC